MSKGVTFSAAQAIEVAYNSQFDADADEALADKVYAAGQAGQSIALTADEVSEVIAWLESGDFDSTTRTGAAIDRKLNLVVGRGSLMSTMNQELAWIDQFDKLEAHLKVCRDEARRVQKRMETGGASMSEAQRAQKQQLAALIRTATDLMIEA